MSFEVNGNSGAPRRRKNRDKQNVPNFHSPPFPNTNIPEHAPYYFPVSYQHMNTEPMSLPVNSFPYQSFSHYTTPRLYINPPSNKYTSLQNNHNEYTSLPIGPLDQNENASDKRRYSDPGVPCDSDSSSTSLEERFVHKLTQQMSALKESNRKLNREVVELRIELNLLKQQQSVRHFDREYEPGMLAEIVKEIRDAARVREDALVAKVKHMIEEKQFNMNQLQMVNEKTRNHERISKLEEQLKNLNVSNNRSEDNNVSLSTSLVADESSNSARQVFELEREMLVLRKELQDARSKRDESDQKLIQLDKKLALLLRHKEALRCDSSEDGKTSDSLSLTTTMSSVPPLIIPQRFTLTGPVTDL